MDNSYIDKVFYIHGFASSSKSPKVQALKDFCATLKVEAIGLDYDSTLPRHQIMKKLSADINKLGGLHNLLIGTSLGAYYAVCLASKRKDECIIMNPCLAPSESLQKYNLPDEVIQSYQGFDNPTIYACSVFLETGDELFDYRLAEKHFANNGVTVIEGGSHRFENLDLVLQKVKSYCNWELTHYF